MVMVYKSEAHRTKDAFANSDSSDPANSDAADASKSGKSDPVAADSGNSGKLVSAADSYMGCYKDDSKRYLGYAHISTKDMTRQKCVDHCTTSGFKYAGVQDGSHCFCDNPGPRGLGAKIDESKCKTACRGNKSETCGGDYANNIFSTSLANAPDTTNTTNTTTNNTNTTTTTATVPSATQATSSTQATQVSTIPQAIGGEYMGCFRDDEKRYLEYGHITRLDMTKQKCVDHCSSSGFKYAGLQSNTHCFCGNPGPRGMGTKLDEKYCKSKCIGDKSQTCGGEYANSIYTTGK
jgi:hypothetical protein